MRTHRVIKTRDGSASRGVHRQEEPRPRIKITRVQARVAFGIVTLGLLLWSGWWAYHSPWLTVRHVTVIGASKLDPEQVRAAAALDGTSIFGLDLAAGRARVAALPNVRSASVRKDGRNGIAITVEERTAWGSWQLNGANVPVDADGYVLNDPAADGAPVIQEITSAQAPIANGAERIDAEAVVLAARLMRESDAALGRQVLALVYRRDAGLTAVLSGSEVDARPIWVTFGDARDYDYKVAALYALIEQAREQELTLNTVDLRFGDRLSFN